MLRGLIMRPIEGEWEAWAAQEREVARALKAGLQSKGQEGEKEEEDEEPASVVSMKGTYVPGITKTVWWRVFYRNHKSINHLVTAPAVLWLPS